MILSRHNLRRRMVSIGVLLLVFILAPALFAADAQEDQAATPEETVSIEIKESASTFEYQTEDRPDPFAPFVSGPARTNPVTPDEIVENNEVLTGMQLFEPGQLTLVALMLTGNTPYAMVQDFTGRGYIIEEGMKIGRRGVITQIAEDRVIIEETAQTRSGKTLKNEIAMVLKKEGEE
jgi:type IV pilus assembly protein PilP